MEPAARQGRCGGCNCGLVQCDRERRVVQPHRGFVFTRTAATVGFGAAPSALSRGALARPVLVPYAPLESLAATPRYVFWTRLGVDDGGVFRAAKRAGSRIRKVGNDDYPGYVTIAGGSLYWQTDEGGIARANLDGSGLMHRFVRFPGHRIDGLATDGRYLYFSDCGNSASIGRVKPDGSQLKRSFVSLAGGSAACTGPIAYASGHLYWAHATPTGQYETGVVGRVAADGSDREPNRLAVGTATGLAAGGGMLFWIQYHAKKATTVGEATSQGRLLTRNLEPALHVGVGP